MLKAIAEKYFAKVVIPKQNAKKPPESTLHFDVKVVYLIVLYDRVCIENRSE